MATGLGRSVHGPVGRPRKHEGGWECANKQICIANETFKKWKSLKEDLQLVNDDAVACYLLGAAESLNESRKNGLECEKLVGSNSSGIHITLSIVNNPGEFQPSSPVLSSTPIVESQSSCRQ